MNTMFRRLGALAATGLFFTSALSGCSAQGGGEEAELGSLSLPLSATAPSGAYYRLRDAKFEIWDRYSWEDGYGNAGGSGGYGTMVVVDSEDHNPDVGSIVVDLEQGSYAVSLYPGWRIEKVVGDTVTDVEATLLSRQTVNVRVTPRSTTWAEYQFGIGDSALWLNGKLNLDIHVYEDPSELYGVGGGGGAGGYDGVGGGGGDYYGVGGGDYGTGGSAP